MRSDDWYVVRLQPTLELLASEFLIAELSAEIYYPIERGKRVRQHALADYERAAFPGYLYARFPSPPDWRRVSEHCRAKPRLIMREGTGEDAELHPLCEHDDSVCRLRTREESGQFSVGMQNPFIAKLLNAKVVVPCGPFRDQLAQVSGIKAGMVTIKFRAIGKWINMTISFDQAFPGRMGT